jgi:hypothetical protein
MTVRSRIRTLERQSTASDARVCGCGVHILWTNRSGDLQVFTSLREYYKGTVIDGPPTPGRKQRPAEIPDRCSRCGLRIDWVRVYE